MLWLDSEYAFLLTDDVLDYQRYDEELDHELWEKCDLRIWTNTVFYNTAFTDKEKKFVGKSLVYNDNK